jgi:phosphate transport system permease protein
LPNRLVRGRAERITSFERGCDGNWSTDGAGHGLAVLATMLVIAPLVAIFVYLVYKGASSLNLDFFTKIPKPVGEMGGGMANAIVGSACCWALASLIGIPIGIGGGIYLAEFGRGTKLANASASPPTCSTAFRPS